MKNILHSILKGRVIMAISQKDIDTFVGPLKKILEAELIAGNVIRETWNGWPSENVSTISLSKPFLTPVNKNIQGVDFYNTNDPHYWKAEYYDKVNQCGLICGFNGPDDLKWEF